MAQSFPDSGTRGQAPDRDARGRAPDSGTPEQAAFAAHARLPENAGIGTPPPSAGVGGLSPSAGVGEQGSNAPLSPPALYQDADFPGCESFHLPASEIDHYDGRLEFWDGYTETAWKVCEPTSIQHEGPSRRLVRMAERVASLRGSQILCLGSSDLVRLDARGRKRWLMQADEVLYLHPDQVRLQGSAIDVDADPLPDVALEVDHTTDVRRRKLDIYKESGFPEIWVLVPWEASARTPGLAIHVRREDGYREEAASRAFPGWKAEEIHRALTEEPLSAGARRALERVALAMGAREGTRPEDDPFTRSVSLRARASGHAQGRMDAVVATLRARGIGIAWVSAEGRELLAGLPIEPLMAAALACTDEADFRRRIREAGG